MVFAIVNLVATAVVFAPVASAIHCWQPDPPDVGRDAGAALPPHPRLRVNASKLAALKRTIETDPTAKAYFEGLQVRNLLCGTHANLVPMHTAHTQTS